MIYNFNIHFSYGKLLTFSYSDENALNKNIRRRLSGLDSEVLYNLDFFTYSKRSSIHRIYGPAELSVNYIRSRGRIENSSKLWALNGKIMCSCYCSEEIK